MVILSSDERFADPPLSATAYSWRQDDSWKTDKHLCLEKVKENGLYLATAAEEMRSNRRIVLAAVKSDGHALNVASEGLKNDEEIVFAAIEQDGDSLSFAGDTLRNRKDVLEAALGRPFLTKEEMDQAARETEVLREVRDLGVEAGRQEGPRGGRLPPAVQRDRLQLLEGQVQAPGQGPPPPQEQLRGRPRGGGDQRVRGRRVSAASRNDDLRRGGDTAG
jgi:hypothetical protein